MTVFELKVHFLWSFNKKSSILKSLAKRKTSGFTTKSEIQVKCIIFLHRKILQMLKALGKH